MLDKGEAPAALEVLILAHMKTRIFVKKFAQRRYFIFEQAGLAITLNRVQ